MRNVVVRNVDRQRPAVVWPVRPTGQRIRVRVTTPVARANGDGWNGGARQHFISRRAYLLHAVLSTQPVPWWQRLLRFVGRRS